jgi:hypothetical protein
MEVQYGRRALHNDRKHCWSNVDTDGVAFLVGYFTSPQGPPAFARLLPEKSSSKTDWMQLVENLTVIWNILITAL